MATGIQKVGQMLVACVAMIIGFFFWAMAMVLSIPLAIVRWCQEQFPPPNEVWNRYNHPTVAHDVEAGRQPVSAQVERREPVASTAGNGGRRMVAPMTSGNREHTAYNIASGHEHSAYDGHESIGDASVSSHTHVEHDEVTSRPKKDEPHYSSNAARQKAVPVSKTGRYYEPQTHAIPEVQVNRQ
ncbi:hypothetical protein BDQ12DRAFT_693606 [Crucibulum laeve]|uniref:Uncharacterized protein n=1 Tax=Crucibulum laeve TaxID=68775 RepID=A0A5C3LSK1_9AGAR|nr:hypothetical protein BDQ12DRAFT_693606 [Crucibulum laeve]